MSCSMMIELQHSLKEQALWEGGRAGLGSRVMRVVGRVAGQGEQATELRAVF